jgi:probable F420-dependent oxidoreductase
MRFGFMMGYAIRDGCAYPDYLTQTVVRAEEVGFESVWIGEHVVMPDHEPTYPYSADGRAPVPNEADVPDPLVWLAFAAALTTRIKLATGVLILPLRNPVVLAKEVATLDVLSGGRAVLGVGVGWMREESEVVGLPFHNRGRRTDELIRAIRTIWANDVASFYGEGTRFSGARSFPKPMQDNRQVPIVVGGSGPAAARRAGRLGDGYYPIAPTIESLAEQIGMMRKAAEDAGRDPDTVDITTLALSLAGPDPVTRTHLDELRRMEDLGVTRIVAPRLLDSDLSTMLANVDRLSDELIDAF